MLLPVPGPRPRRPRPDPGDKADPEQNLLFSQGFSMGSMGSAADPGAGRWGAPAGRGLQAISFPSFSNGFSMFSRKVFRSRGPAGRPPGRRVQETNRIPTFLKRPPPRADAVQGAWHLLSTECLNIALMH